MGKTHARLSASSAHRWIPCPGSVTLERDFPDETSPHAHEGTAAHALFEGILRKELTDDQVKPGLVLDTDDGPYTVTREMIGHVQTFVEYVRAAADGNKLAVEQQISLEKLAPPTEMFGTADIIIWNEAEKILDVIDLKYGTGVFVEAEDNPQLAYYMLGAVLKIGKRPEVIRGTIFQPRNTGMDDEAARSWSLTWDELLAWKDTILKAANEAMEDNAPLVPGEKQCKFCKAKAVCPALKGQSLEVARLEFDVVAEGGYKPPVPESLTDEEVSVILAHAKQIGDWLSSVQDHAKKKLLAGKEVPGWKLVEGRASRSWADPEKAERYLRRKIGAKGAIHKSLISPSQAEKVAPDLPAELIAVNRGISLVPVSNSKPAITAVSAADEFSTKE